ncbi:MAG: aryl-sulfate sulfotransferase [Bacteroidota bacterium]
MRFVFYLLLLLPFSCFSQNTVGLISLLDGFSIGGYNLIYPENQSTVFLLNECGEIVHTWEDHPDNRPGKTAYLLPNGNLLRSKIDVEKMTEPTIGTGGGGGVIELLTWNNETQWCYVLADEDTRQHHDIHYMENGHVLLIAWERIGFDEMLENGFDSTANMQDSYWPDFIRELNPVTNDTVWEWHAWDHLVQDYDSTRLNFGTVSDHPELIDINYNEYSAGRPDWMHSNAIDYDPVKDQIVLSVRNFNEIWIIDHSTTTGEAAGHTGGNSGKGGDLLFRWGNPKAYKRGATSDRQLFLQHDAQWIDDFVDPDYEFYGHIALYNNFINGNTSLGQVLSPVWDSLSNSYLQTDGLFLPTGFSRTFSHPDTSKNLSGIASSIQIMGDGHVIFCAANQGFLFELTPEDNVVWQYRTPIKLGYPIEQGTILNPGNNVTFQLERYPENFSGLLGKDLSAKGFIELNPNTSFCLFTDVEEIKAENDLNIFPNPAGGYLFIENNKGSVIEITVFNSLGRTMLAPTIISGTEKLDVTKWPDGIYFLKEKNKNKINRFVVSK